MNKIKLNKFKQEIVEIFDLRQSTYDTGKSGDWHYNLACRLVECADLQLGQRVLDLATGTGMVALEAAKKVGSSGKVIGVDISSGMLEVAREKINIARLNDNITLQLADIEALDFAENSFDRIFCCSAFPLLTDIPQDLLLWHSFLVSGGKICLCVFAETAFVYGVVLQKVARRYDINIVMSDHTGTPHKCRALLSSAGYQDIEIATEQYGKYVDLELLLNQSWDTNLKHPQCFALRDLPAQELEKIKAEYMEELKALVTKEGIWNDVTTYFVVATKP